jgi:hypothetical protein
MTERAWVSYAAAAAVGLLVAVMIFSLPVLAGTGAFWTAPNYPDMQQHLSAQEYYLHDGWRWPITLVGTILPPDGVSLVFLDGNPLMAIPSKLLFKATGLYVNYFGPWLMLCYALQAASFLFLCRSLGLRGLVPAVAAGLIAVSVPEFLFRYFHMTLLGQFLITTELGLYFLGVRQGLYRRASRLALGLALLTVVIHFYIFAMVAPIYLALLAHYAGKGRDARRDVARQAGVLAVGTGILLVSLGYLHGLGGSSGFGYFSMNLLSPFVPQRSGLIPGMSAIIDGTGGQYEGFNYLGAGVLALTLLALALNRNDLWAEVKRYRWLLVLFVLFTGFAVSFNPMLGDIALLHPGAHPAAQAVSTAVASAPAPVHPAGLAARIKEAIFYPLQQFRASGRFFWAVGYALAAFGIVGVWRRLPSAAGLAVLSLAAGLQFIDAAPLRDAMADAFHDPVPSPVGPDPWVKMIAAHREITVLPSMDCADKQSQLITLFVFYASENQVLTHSAKLSRGPKADCPAEFGALASRQLGADEILVLLAPPIEDAAAQAMPNAADLCRKFSLGYVCSHKWAELDAAGIKLTDRDLEPPKTAPYNPAGDR